MKSIFKLYAILFTFSALSCGNNVFNDALNYYRLIDDNKKPVAEDGTINIPMNTAVTIQLSATDEDGDELVFYLDSTVENGTLSGKAPSLTYTPPADYIGTDSFTFHVNDGLKDSDTAEYHIIVDKVLYVDISATGSNDGSSWENAFTHPQDAVNSAASGEKIWTAQGNYKAKNQADVYVLQMKDGVALFGGFNGSENKQQDRDWENNKTILNGDFDGDEAGDQLHVVIGANNARLDGFTVKNGNANGAGDDSKGAGMLNTIKSPVIANCLFTNNSSGNGGGGGIYFIDCPETTIISGCTFSSNNASDGGGGAINLYRSSINISECTFTGNVIAANNGPAIMICNSSPSINNCTFYNNTGTDSATSGGGIYMYSSSMPLINGCFFIKNSVGDSGGAILHWGGSVPVITNCVFIENHADKDGGAIRSDLNAVITNCTFVNNTAGSAGGNIWCNEPYSSQITNSIIWGGSPDQIAINNNATPVVTYCNIQGGYTGTGNIDADPLFADISNPDSLYWDIHLQSWSPCIDKGNNNAPEIPSTDFESDDRIIDGGGPASAIVDIGADEYSPSK